MLRKRTDGYHDIETVFVRIPWTDVLHAEPAGELQLTCTDPHLPVDNSNLVMQAARALHAHRGASLVLEKHLPIGSGLGGGSSDAATALLLLNEVWELRRSTGELFEIAARIGSDIPFFLGPEAAVGTGRGERLDPLIDPETEEPYRPPFSLVVAVPPVQIATAKAYASITPHADRRPDLRRLILSNDLERWRRELVNDFEAPIFEAYPVVAEVKNALRRAGAGYASLSGSGAAVYGMFENEEQAQGATEALRESGQRIWHGRV